MRDDLSESQQRLRDSLFDLYEIGGLELYLAGSGGMKRELIIDLDASALMPETVEIVHFYAVNHWDEDDEDDAF